MSDSIEKFINNNLSSFQDLKNLDSIINEMNIINNVYNEMKIKIEEEKTRKKQDIVTIIDKIKLILKDLFTLESQDKSQTKFKVPKEFRESKENVEQIDNNQTKESATNISIYPELLHLLIKLEEIGFSSITISNQIIDRFILPIVDNLKEKLLISLLEKGWGKVPLKTTLKIEDKPHESSVNLEVSDFLLMEELFMLQILTWSMENISGKEISQFQYLWFLETLLQPFLVRFSFFFESDKKTNHIANPEYVVSFFETIQDLYIPTLIEIVDYIISNTFEKYKSFFEDLSLDNISLEKALDDIYSLLLVPVSNRFKQHIKLLYDSKRNNEVDFLYSKIFDSIIEIEKTTLKCSSYFSIIKDIFSNDLLLERLAIIDRDLFWDSINENEIDFNPAPLQASKFGIIPTVSTYTFIDRFNIFKNRLEYIENKQIYTKNTFAFVLDKYLKKLTFSSELPDILNSKKPIQNDIDIWRKFCRVINSIAYIQENIEIWTNQAFLFDKEEDKSIIQMRTNLEESHLIHNSLLNSSILDYFNLSFTDYTNALYILKSKSLCGSNMTLAMSNLLDSLVRIWNLISEELNQNDFNILFENFSRKLDIILSKFFIDEDNLETTEINDLACLVSTLAKFGNTEQFFPNIINACKEVYLSHEVNLQ